MKMSCVLPLAVMFFLFSSVSIPGRFRGKEVVMFWNLENFFVPWGVADSLTAEFRYGGKRGWNYERFLKKCAAVAKTVVYLEDSLGRRPGFLAFAEVEDGSVLYMLLSHTPLHGYPYCPLHYDSPDRRGIDVGLLYDSSRYRLVRSFSRPLVLDSSVIATRAILYSCFERRSSGDTLHVFVNHHPSKFSGAEATQPLRDAAMGLLAFMADSVASRHPGHAVVLTGDFNDVPASDSVAGAPGFRNLSHRLHREGAGTIKYSGKWEMIDHFIVSESIAPKCSTYIFSPLFLLEKDRKTLGYKPRRTYVGPRYTGGVSDHLPVVLEIFY